MSSLKRENTYMQITEGYKENLRQVLSDHTSPVWAATWLHYASRHQTRTVSVAHAFCHLLCPLLKRMMIN